MRAPIAGIAVRNFLKIADGVDTLPILAALNARSDLWNENPLRSTYPGSPHSEVDDVWLWFEGQETDVVNDVQTHPYRGWNELPVKDVVLNLMRRVNGTQLGRVVITRLPPGKRIAPHSDQGAPATFYQRHQLMLQARPGCVFRVREEVIQPLTGECFWFDNTQEHSVENHSDSDRIAMVIDVRVA
jgi:hypothetical protein